MRQVFFNVGNDLIEELVGHKGIKLSSKAVDKLTKILVRYTVGFGLIEVLLQDEKIQDITINSPMGQTPMFLVHQDFCKSSRLFILMTKSSFFAPNFFIMSAATIIISASAYGEEIPKISTFSCQCSRSRPRCGFS